MDLADQENRANDVVRFGVFEVDLRAGELRKKGHRVKLQEKPLQALALLLEHPGELVTREELRERLWPPGTFVEFDDNLNSTVKRLRESLGDSADAPRFIETIPRRGYRFISPVERLKTTPASEGQSASTPPSSGSSTLGPAWSQPTAGPAIATTRRGRSGLVLGLSAAL